MLPSSFSRIRYRLFGCPGSTTRPRPSVWMNSGFSTSATYPIWDQQKLTQGALTGAARGGQRAPAACFCPKATGGSCRRRNIDRARTERLASCAHCGTWTASAVLPALQKVQPGEESVHHPSEGWSQSPHANGSAHLIDSIPAGDVQTPRMRSFDRHAYYARRSFTPVLRLATRCAASLTRRLRSAVSSMLAATASPSAPST